MKEWVSKLKFLDEEVLSKKIYGNIDVGKALVLTAICIYSIAFSYYTIMRHYSFRSDAWDLGIFSQVLYSTINGKIFYYNVEPYFNPSHSFLGIHFSPILFLLVPFYAIFPKPETLLVAQSVILALAAYPLYLYSFVKTKSKTLSLAVSVAYLLNPLIQGVNWYDFHPQAFLPLFYFSMLYFLERKRTLSYLIFLLLSLCVLEQISIINIFLAISLFLMYYKNIIKCLKNKNIIDMYFIVPCLTLIISIYWLIMSNAIIRYFNPNPPLYLKGLGTFGILGARETSEVPLFIFAHPSKALKALNYDYYLKTTYVILSFTPLAFTSLLSPTLLIPAIPWLIVALFSNHKPYYMLGYQYSALLVPFIFLSGVNGLKKVLSIVTEYRGNVITIKNIARLILIINLVLAILFSPLSILAKPYSFEWCRDFGITYPSYEQMLLIDFLSKIPNDAVILSTSNIFPHISSNINAYTLPGIHAIPFKLLNFTLNYLKKKNYDFIVVSVLQDRETAKLVIEQFVEQYGDKYKPHSIIGTTLVFSSDESFNVIKPVIEPMVFKPWDLAVEDGELIRIKNSTYGVVIKSLITSPFKDQKNTIWFGPYTILPPGYYIVVFRIKFLNITNLNTRIITLDVTSNSGSKILAFLNIFPQDVKEDTWVEITIPLYITSYEYYVEFRGVNAKREAIIFLDYVKVIPVKIGKPAYNARPLYIYDYRRLAPISASYVLDKDSISKIVLFRKPGEKQKQLCYGPFEALPKGAYEVIYTVKINGTIDPQEKILTMLITGENMTTPISKVSLYGIHVPIINKWLNITTKFILPNDTSGVQYALLVNSENIGVYLDRILVRQVSKEEVPMVYMLIDYTKLSTINAKVAGNIIKHSVGDGEGVVWFGPYIDLPPGKYIIKYWLRVNSYIGEHIIDLDVACNYGKNVLVAKQIRSADVPELGVWFNVSLELEVLEYLKAVEFRGYNVANDTDIELLLIEIYGWKI